MQVHRHDCESYNSNVKMVLGGGGGGGGGLGGLTSGILSLTHSGQMSHAL